jgi:DNA polymerase-3 subunit beta
MQFEINSINFSKLINQVNRARNKNTLNPHLNNIYLELNNNLLTGRATNLEITCEKSIPVKGVINGKCLLNGDVITKISNSFSNIDTNILCEIVDDVLNISYQKNKIHLKTSPFEDFPNLPQAGKLITNINLKTFIDLIKSVSFCAASTEIKPEISSVYFYSKNNELYSVATDSFRLAEKRIGFKIDEDLDINILISQKCINEAISIFESIIENEDDMLNIYKNENTLTLESKDTVIAMRSINGNFPDYKQLFPKE